MYIWLAPADGLYLDRIMFSGYNLKQDVKVKLEFDPQTEQLIETFRSNVILKQIISAEIQDQKYFFIFIVDFLDGNK